MKKAIVFIIMILFSFNLVCQEKYIEIIECLAVANAHPDLKALGQKIIGSNIEDGVACFLKDRLG
jgi:hypothetical protein